MRNPWLAPTPKFKRATFSKRAAPSQSLFSLLISGILRHLMIQSSYIIIMYVMPNHPDCKFNLIWNQKRLFSVVTARQKELSEELMAQNARNSVSGHDITSRCGCILGAWWAKPWKPGFARFAKRSKFGRKRSSVRSDTRSAVCSETRAQSIQNVWMIYFC